MDAGQRWCYGAKRSRLQPIKEFVTLVEKHWEGIIAWHASHLSNGLLEGINSLVQAAKARARGYRSKTKMITILYLTAAKLQLPHPHQPNPRLHVLTLSNPLKTAKSLVQGAAVDDTASAAGSTGCGHPPGENGPGRTRAVAHAHPTVQECERLVGKDDILSGIANFAHRLLGRPQRRETPRPAP